jgi:hypothetical protein
VGDLVKAIEPYTEADPVAVLVHSLCSFGNVIGRSAYFSVEYTRHYSNLFAVLVGDTSRARKGTSRSTADHCFQQIDHDWQTKRTLDGLSSGQGLIWNVRDAIVREKDGTEEVIDPGEPDKRLFVVEEEFAQALKSMPLEGNILSVILREAWDTGTLRTLTSGRRVAPVCATGAHVSIVGHITRSELLRHLDSTEQCSGRRVATWVLTGQFRRKQAPKWTPGVSLPLSALCWPLTQRCRFPGRW